MSLNRSAIKLYADTYWWRPCRDGKVWLSNQPIVESSELSKRGLSASDWQGVFLNYDAERYFDGFYLLKKTQVPQLASKSYYAPNFSSSDCILVRDWWGLNDCAHFASECLKAGGVGAYDISVSGLISKLRAAASTKTLAYFVPLAMAQRIVSSGVMQIGDIVAFGADNQTFTHGHSTIFMGGNKVANHTHLNHPSFTGGGSQYGHGIWQRYADVDTGHPRVILIHFGDDDPPLVGNSMVGWWSTKWLGKDYYYYFKETGRVFWVGSKPTSKKEPGAPQGKGYWFQNGSDVQICWTSTGSYEVYSKTGGSTLSGKCNDLPLSLSKM